jgi:hypothetical protein
MQVNLETASSNKSSNTITEVEADATQAAALLLFHTPQPTHRVQNSRERAAMSNHRPSRTTPTNTTSKSSLRTHRMLQLPILPKPAMLSIRHNMPRLSLSNAVGMHCSQSPSKGVHSYVHSLPGVADATAAT